MKKTERHWHLCLFGIIYLSLSAFICAAEGAPVTFYFQGTISSVDPVLSSGIDSNIPLSGSFTFESTTPDLVPASTTFGRYALNSLSYSVGGHSFSATAAPGAANVITISNQQDPTFDRYDVAITANLSGPTVGGVTNNFFYFQLDKAGMFSHDGLPTSPPSLASVANSFWMARFIPGAQTIQGEITSLTLTAVPLPGALILFGSGVGFLAYTLRKTRGLRTTL